MTRVGPLAVPGRKAGHRDADGAKTKKPVAFRIQLCVSCLWESNFLSSAVFLHLPPLLQNDTSVRTKESQSRTDPHRRRGWPQVQPPAPRVLSNSRNLS